MRKFEMVKKCLVMFLFCLFLYPGFANAETKLEVKVEYGVDNKVQMGKGHPVKIELMNKGDAVKGDIVLFVSPSYNMAGSYVVPVELEAGGTKTIELSVKGSNDNYYYSTGGTQPNLISFYEGGIEKGKEVKLSGNVSAKPRFMQDNRLVLGVLSNNHDAVNYIKLLKYQSEAMELLNIKKENIPEKSFGLELFDVILVHDFPLSTLTSEQQTAIKEWVRSGGALMYDTKVGIGRDFGDLQDFILLNPNGETTIFSINSESSFPNLPVFTGEVKQEDVKVITKDVDTPLTLTKNVGSGTVTQVTSTLSSKEWKEWEGLNNWWSSVIQKASSKNVNYYRAPLLEELSYQLSSIGEMFPGSIVSVPLLIGAFVIYLIILIPVLYVILKKSDKREHAWWIIPSIAIITSIGVFGLGAKDRIAGTQINESSILVLDNDSELASGFGVASILTNSGGEYRVETEHPQADLFPVTYGYNDNFELLKNYAYLRTGATGTDITFKNVEYWSIRTSVGDVNSVPLGKMDYELNVNDGKIIGKLSNHLTYELKDVHLLSGRNSHKLGDIKAGEEAKVEYDLQGNIANALTSPNTSAVTRTYPNFGQMYQGGPVKIDKSELEGYKKFQMLDFLINQRNLYSITDRPLVIGYIEHDLMGTKVNGKSANQKSLHLVAIPVTIQNTGTGSFSFSEEHFTPSIAVTEGESGNIYHNGLDYGDNYIHVSTGSYTVSYKLPEILKMDRDVVKEIKLKLRTRDGNLEYFIENQATKELEPLESKSTVSIEKNPENYISGDRELNIIIKVPMNFDSELMVPGVQLEGELRQ